MSAAVHDVLVGLCLVLVAVGAVPVVVGAYQFLLIPFHAVRHHYRRAAPHLPRVAVIVPAWNEGQVIGRSIDRLMALEYPGDSLRVYVVDDASTDDTPDVVQDRVARYPDRVFHLRRERGGQGKAHTLNHGISVVLGEDWMQALLIMDADVIYRPDSLRKMTRHLADPRVGAVTAYIREGSGDANYLTRFIAYEYAAAQAASRRAQNVLGALACLAGGAQLHSRENLVAIGGRIDTTTLAEDTVTTFNSQLAGRQVVFEPHAVVLAEEPSRIEGLWKQRLRWARGNTQVTKMFSHLWFRPWKDRHLGGISFGLFWFCTYWLPVLMVLSTAGLFGLYVLESSVAATIFRWTWFLAGGTYVFMTLMVLQLDWATARRCWREAITFPGIISLAVMSTAFVPTLFDTVRPRLFGMALGPVAVTVVTLCIYGWLVLSMLLAWLAKRVERTRIGRLVSPALVYLVGYGAVLCAITADSYVKEFRHAERVWDKTEKTGRVTV
jgi:cellulose synthase/poly-beta-1,6-N-acetylglucosamine synthase-like glycosyltransferase